MKKPIEIMKKASVLAMSSMMMASTGVTAFAASSTDSSNNTATTNDLDNADIIDESRKGSLSIYKYDITSAEAAGVYAEGTEKATGEKDAEVEEKMKDYAIEGVEFSYLRVGNVEQHSIWNGYESTVELIFEIPDKLADILGLTEEDDAINGTLTRDTSAAEAMDREEEADRCLNEGVRHYTSEQIQNALSKALEEDNVKTKNALEEYLHTYNSMNESSNDDETANGATAMPKTDTNGYTSVSGLDLGLYLIVETEVPEQVTATVDPFFVQMPFTNQSKTGDDDEGGERWLYDMTVYPKNQTGNPTLDKSVRNAYNNVSDDADKNSNTQSGEKYEGSNASNSLLVYNTKNHDSLDRSAADYVANRGGYTLDNKKAGGNAKEAELLSTDYAYADTTTASEGDLLDYILVSKMPTISSSATHLSEYGFQDKLGQGISYNKDTKIAIYSSKEDAKANNTVNAEAIWGAGEGYFTTDYKDGGDGSTIMSVDMTEKALKEINLKYSDFYMVVYYTATVNSDNSVILGDEGNENDVSLTWQRTSAGYYNTLEDVSIVYTYGLDLAKVFSDGSKKFDAVQFKMYNKTDDYYVVAEKKADGIYYVTGKATAEKEGTTFIPAADGKLMVYGLEGDVYTITEIATANGFSLLKKPITVDIQEAQRDIVASVAGTTGLVKADLVNATNIIANYNNGIKNNGISGNTETGINDGDPQFVDDFEYSVTMEAALKKAYEFLDENQIAEIKELKNDLDSAKASLNSTTAPYASAGTALTAAQKAYAKLVTAYNKAVAAHETAVNADAEAKANATSAANKLTDATQAETNASQDKNNKTTAYNTAKAAYETDKADYEAKHTTYVNAVSAYEAAKATNATAVDAEKAALKALKTAANDLTAAVNKMKNDAAAYNTACEKNYASKASKKATYDKSVTALSKAQTAYNSALAAWKSAVQKVNGSSTTFATVKAETIVSSSLYGSIPSVPTITSSHITSYDYTAGGNGTEAAMNTAKTAMDEAKAANDTAKAKMNTSEETMDQAKDAMITAAIKLDNATNAKEAAQTAKDKADAAAAKAATTLTEAKNAMDNAEAAMKAYETGDLKAAQDAFASAKEDMEADLDKFNQLATDLYDKVAAGLAVSKTVTSDEVTAAILQGLNLTTSLTKAATELIAKRDAAEVELDAAKAALQTAKANLDSASSEYAASKEAFKTAENKFKKAEANLKAAEEALKTANAILASSSTDSTGAQEALDKAITALTEADTALANAHTEMTEADTVLTNAQNAAQSAVANADAEVNVAKGKLADAQSVYNEKLNALNEAESTLKLLTDNVETLDTELAAAQAAAKAAGEAFKTASDNLDKAQADVDAKLEALEAANTSGSKDVAEKQQAYDEAVKKEYQASEKKAAAEITKSDAEAAQAAAQSAYEDAVNKQQAAANALPDAQAKYNDAKNGLESAQTNLDTKTAALETAQAAWMNAQTNYETTREKVYDTVSKLSQAMASYNNLANGGIVASDVANGRTIGKTSVYMSDVQSSAAYIDGKETQMRNSNNTDSIAALAGIGGETEGVSSMTATNEIKHCGTSDNFITNNALVKVGVTNSKSFLLPVTGGKGIYAMAIAGVVAVAVGCYVINRGKEEKEVR